MSKRKGYEFFNGQAGDRYGRLTLTGVSFIHVAPTHRGRMVEAVCDCCDEVKNYWFHLLKSGETKSCGCLQKELLVKRSATHHMTATPLHYVWIEMKQRCFNKKHKHFKNWGGRGITVCEEWKNDFLCFYKWAIQNGYVEGLDLDRINNNGNYEPSNCRFTTRKIGSKNTRRNRMFTAFRETKCLFDWGRDERCKVTVWALRSRVDRGNWPDFEKALTTPQKDRFEVARKMKSTVMVTAFGETKCLAEWVQDKRCVVAMDRLRDRIAEGWDHLEAITTVHDDKRAGRKVMQHRRKEKHEQREMIIFLD